MVITPPTMPKPGNRVACQVHIPPSPDGRMHEIREGTTGLLVRLVHTRIEGEPFPDRPTGDMTIAHVRWDGDEDILPIGVGLLRVLPPEITGPIDPEVLQIVEQLKRSLSERNMRFVIDQLTKELEQSRAR